MENKKIYTFKIEGETPAKKNSRIVLKNGRNIPSKRYQKWHQSAVMQVQLLGEKPDNPIDYPVLVHLKFTHGDLRRRDSDNGCSSIMDMLVDEGVLSDDNWQIVKDIGISNEYRKNDAFCEVTIQEL